MIPLRPQIRPPGVSVLERLQAILLLRGHLADPEEATTLRISYSDLEEIVRLAEAGRKRSR